MKKYKIKLILGLISLSFGVFAVFNVNAMEKNNKDYEDKNLVEIKDSNFLFKEGTKDFYIRDRFFQIQDKLKNNFDSKSCVSDFTDYFIGFIFFNLAKICSTESFYTLNSEKFKEILNKIFNIAFLEQDKVITKYFCDNFNIDLFFSCIKNLEMTADFDHNYRFTIDLEKIKNEEDRKDKNTMELLGNLVEHILRLRGSKNKNIKNINYHYLYEVILLELKKISENLEENIIKIIHIQEKLSSSYCYGINDVKLLKIFENLKDVVDKLFLKEEGIDKDFLDEKKKLVEFRENYMRAVDSSIKKIEIEKSKTEDFFCSFRVDHIESKCIYPLSKIVYNLNKTVKELINILNGKADSKGFNSNILKLIEFFEKFKDEKTANESKKVEYENEELLYRLLDCIGNYENFQCRFEALLELFDDKIMKIFDKMKINHEECEKIVNLTEKWNKIFGNVKRIVSIFEKIQSGISKVFQDFAENDGKDFRENDNKFEFLKDKIFGVLGDYNACFENLKAIISGKFAYYGKDKLEKMYKDNKYLSQLFREVMSSISLYFVKNIKFSSNINQSLFEVLSIYVNRYGDSNLHKEEILKNISNYEISLKNLK